MIGQSAQRMAAGIFLLYLINGTITAQAADSPLASLHLHEHTQASAGHDVVTEVPAAPRSSLLKLRDETSAPECDGQHTTAGTLRTLLKRITREPLTEETRLCVTPPEEEKPQAQPR